MRRARGISFLLLFWCVLFFLSCASADFSFSDTRFRNKFTTENLDAIIDEYEYKSVLTDDEEFLLLEAFDFMIETTKQTQWMKRIGIYLVDY